MTSSLTLLIGTGVLAVGTLAFRLAGPGLRTWTEPSPRLDKLLAVSAVVVFSALVATATLFDGHHLTGFARPIGVGVAGILAWRKAPFVVVVLAAAGITAGLRLMGMS